MRQKIKDYESFDLLLEIQRSVNRLEDKMDARMTVLEDRVDKNETKLDTIIGKIGIVVSIVTLIVAGIVTLIFDFIKKSLRL